MQTAKFHPEKLESKTMEAKKFGFDSFINLGNLGFLSSVFSLNPHFEDYRKNKLGLRMTETEERVCFSFQKTAKWLIALVELG